jgi:hypothetical protein
LLNFLANCGFQTFLLSDDESVSPCKIFGRNIASITGADSMIGCTVDDSGFVMNADKRPISKRIPEDPQNPLRFGQVRECIVAENELTGLQLVDATSAPICHQDPCVSWEAQDQLNG